MLYSSAQSPHHMSYLEKSNMADSTQKHGSYFPLSIVTVSWPSSLNPDLDGYITHLHL